MPIKRTTNYLIEQPGEYNITVTTIPESTVVHLTQEDGAYHDTKTMRITVTFNQLAELITALEEIRHQHAPDTRWER